MALIKKLVSSLPALRRNQLCPACQEPFACELSLAKGCWCSELELSEETRQKLSERFSGCFCRSCLGKNREILSEGRR